MRRFFLQLNSKLNQKMSHAMINAPNIYLQNQTVWRANNNSSCYRWKINGYSKITREGQQSIVSPAFSAIDSKVKWRLKLYPNGRAQGQSNCILLSVHYLSLVNVKARIELSFLNIDNEVLSDYKLNKVVKTVANSQQDMYSRSGDCIKFAKRSDIEDPDRRILADDSLIITFDVTYDDPMVRLPAVSSENEKENLKDERLQEYDDFGKLLENGKLSDVKFVVGDNEIHAHKAILASRSPVFDAMFQHEMREKEKNIVEIVDIDYAVMMELFRFMYTGTVANIELVASDLIIAAEKYCVERLKSLCEKTLLNDLKVDNVLQIFITADNCNAPDLKKEALEFIVKHGSRVTEREEFDLLRVDLVREITRAMARKL